MQEMKLCLGLNGAVMDHSYDKLGHLVEKSYVEWTWRFVSEYGMRLASFSCGTCYVPVCGLVSHCSCNAQLYGESAPVGY
jgi:hypothetical protein